MIGFPIEEFEARTAKAQALMAEADLAALLLTTEPELRYFTGYLTRFWESPTRPWFLIIPATGKPVAVIPSIGSALMGQTWVDEIRTWSAPDLHDDGVSLLAEALCDLTPKAARIGVPDGHETHLRMPLADFERVKTLCVSRAFTGDSGIIRRLRMVKSHAEIAKIEMACGIAGRALARVPEIASAGTALDTVFRKFQILCLEEGADWVPYLAGGAEPGGYQDVISPATPAPLMQGDVLMLDTGVIKDGYFSDFDRNWSIGAPTQATQDAHARLIEATAAAFEIAKPGKTAADLYQAMNTVIIGSGSSAQGKPETQGGTEAGRLGHGLGMSLTEWPSLIPSDHTVLEPGMVLTLEPGVAIGDKIMVHEENIVVTEDTPRFLSPKAGPDIPIL